MKAFVFLCLLAASSAMTIDGKFFEQTFQKKNRAFESELLAVAELIRERILNGDPETGAPVLDPFEKDESSLVLSIPETAEINATLQGVKLTGLGGFEVKKLSYNLIRSRLDFDFLFPVIEGTADNYDLTGNLVEAPLFGTGKGRIALVNLRFSGYAAVSITQLTLKEFKLKIELEAFESQIEGLLGGGDVSDFINEVISMLIPEFIKDKEQQITDAIEKFVLGLLNGSRVQMVQQVEHEQIKDIAREILNKFRI